VRAGGRAEGWPLTAVNVEVEVLLGELFIGAVGTDCSDGGVDLFFQLIFALAQANAHAGAENGRIISHIALVFAARTCVRFQERIKCDSVCLDGVDTTGGQILVGFVLCLVLLDVVSGRRKYLSA
jgi:hypothetical protein